MLPRLANPAEGASAGYGPNAVQVAKPVHLSNLALMLPKDMVLPEGAPITKEEIKKGCVCVFRLSHTCLSPPSPPPPPRLFLL
jgi:hypothetical protein